MKSIVRQLWLYLKWSLNSKYKWFLILFTLWLYRVEFVPDTGVGMAKILQVGTIFGLLFLLWKRQPNLFQRMMRRTNAPVKSVALLYIYAMLSTTWALLPSFAFFLSFQNLVVIMLFTWLFSHFPSVYDLEKAFIFMALFIGLFEFIVLRIQSPILISHFLPGGSLAAMLLSYSIGEYLNVQDMNHKRKTLLRNTALLALFLLIANTSGGANASAALGVGVAMFFGGKKLVAFLVICLGVVLWMNQDWVDDIVLMLMPGKTMEVIESGNGREAIWESIMHYASQKPWFGWGFACVERIEQSIFSGQSLSDAHSNYVGMYGSLGIVGCVLFGWHLLQTFVFTFVRRHKTGFLGLFSAFCCATINGYSYGFLSGKTCSITVVYFMIVILSFYYHKLQQQHG